MLKTFTRLSRITVGALFIFSGLTKLNDPLGFAYKLEAYFAARVLNLPSLIPYALLFAWVLTTAEVLLGVLLLLGYKKKFTLSVLLLLILFFTFLTFYTAYFNKVADCGCFGDAIRLTPWQSFGKNLLLMLLVFILWIGRQHIGTPLSGRGNIWVLFLSLIGCLFLTYRVLTHLPVLDFRPYAVGDDIAVEMKFPKSAPKDVYETTWIYEVNGVEKAFTTQEAPWRIKGAEFVDRQTKLIKKGYVPPIHDLSAERDGIDHLPDFLSRSQMLWIVSYSVSRADRDGWVKANALADALSKAGVPVIGLTASTTKEIQDLQAAFSLPFDFYTCDQTTLKTMIRANPGLILLKKGTVVGKWNGYDTPDIGEILTKLGG
ncbi:MAG: BT_3928 family protein [Flavobacteriales bacterium]